MMNRPAWMENDEPLNVPGRGNVNVDRVVAETRTRKGGERRRADASWRAESSAHATHQHELAAKVDTLSKDIDGLRSRLQQAMDERGSQAQTGVRAAEAQWRALSETVESIQFAMATLEATVEAAAFDREVILVAAREEAAAERKETVQLAVKAAVQAALAVRAATTETDAVAVAQAAAAAAEAEAAEAEAAEAEAAEELGGTKRYVVTFSGFPSVMGEAAVRMTFDSFGEVSDLSIGMSGDGLTCDGEVEFRSVDAAMAAIDKYNGVDMGLGTTLRMSI